MAEAGVQSVDRVQTRHVALRDILAVTGWFAALSAVYWIAVLVVCGRAGFPLDDPFIHLQFAKNLYRDGQMAFNAGVPSSGSTAPLYPVLLAALFSLARDWYLASYLLGGLCSLGTALAVYGIVRSWTGRSDLARWAGILTVIANPTIAQAYSGMESAAYSLVFLLGLWLYASPSRRIVASGVLAVVIWLRPEFMVLFPLILLERMIAARREGGRWLAAGIAKCWPHVAIWSAMILVYVAYHWHQDHHLVPSTFNAKVLVRWAERPVWLDSLPATIRHGEWGFALLALFGWPLVMLLLAGLGLGVVCLPLAFGLRGAMKALWRDKGPAAAGRRLALIVLVGYPLLRGIVDVTGFFWYQNQRYYAHLTPLLILIVLGALPTTGEIVRQRWWSWRGRSHSDQRRRTFQWATLGLVLWGGFAVASVSNITDMQVPAAEWVRRHTTEDQIVAASDIGAMAFISGRRILDIAGLVEPDIVTHVLQGGNELDYLQDRNPAYVVTYPRWYPEFTAREDMLAPVRTWELDFNVVCGGRKIVIYRPLWNTQGGLSRGAVTIDDLTIDD